MRLTNKYNLPQGIVEAIENDPYDPGEGTWMSVTSLIKPPQMAALTKGHGDEIIEDVSDRLWSLLGQSVHEVLARKGNIWDQLRYYFGKILDAIKRAIKTVTKSENLILDEIAARIEVTRSVLPLRLPRSKTYAIKESRLFAECLGKRISGQFDTLSLDKEKDEFVLSDYKVTSWYSVKDGVKREWLEQLNILAWLLEKNGYPKPARLEVHAFLRDYSNAMARREKNYPPCQLVVMPVPEMRHVGKFVEDLVREHQVANPRPCTDEERWAQGECWAVHKKGRKSALKLCQSQEEAKAHQEGIGTPTYIQHRPPVYRRCEDYCQVSAWCGQWKATQEIQSERT